MKLTTSQHIQITREILEIVKRYATPEAVQCIKISPELYMSILEHIGNFGMPYTIGGITVTPSHKLIGGQMQVIISTKNNLKR
jgi:hypothetical protein